MSIPNYCVSIDQPLSWHSVLVYITFWVCKTPVFVKLCITDCASRAKRTKAIQIEWTLAGVNIIACGNIHVFKGQENSTYFNAVIGNMKTETTIPHAVSIMWDRLYISLLLNEAGADLKHWITACPYWLFARMLVGRAAVLRSLRCCLGTVWWIACTVGYVPKAVWIGMVMSPTIPYIPPSISVQAVCVCLCVQTPCRLATCLGK